MAHTSADAVDEAEFETSRRTIYIALIGLMLGMLMAMLDNLIVSTALPTIVGELGGLNHLSWVVTSYALCAAVTTPIWGKLGDLYGRKTMFMISIVMFLIGSALTGQSQTMNQLIAFRGVQGLGAGGLMVGAMSVLGDLVPPRERGRYQPMIAGMMPIAFVGGPLVGGFLTEHLSWRWCFYVNIPIGALALVVCWFGMRLPVRRIKARIDWFGAALLAIGVVSITLVASWGGNDYSWKSPIIIGLAAVSLAAFTAFVFAERAVPEPILPLLMFRDRNFSAAQILSFMVGAAMFGSVNFLPQYMQYVQGVSPTESGLLLLPLMFGMLVMMIANGQYTTRTGLYRIPMIIGTLVLTAGMLVLLLLEVDTSLVEASLLTVFVGFGMGFLMQNTMLVTQNSVELRNMGAASGAVTLFRTLGGSLGIALFGSIYFSRVVHSVNATLGARGKALSSAGARIPPAVVAKLPAELRHAFETAVTSGLHGVLIGGAALTGVAFVVTLFVKQVELRATNGGISE